MSKFLSEGAMTDLLSVQEVASLAATACEWVRRADAETWLGRKEEEVTSG